MNKLLKMTEQQNHLKTAIDKQKSLISEINDLNNIISVKKEQLFKFQGIAEYLTSLGITLTEDTEESLNNREEITTNLET